MSLSTIGTVVTLAGLSEYESAWQQQRTLHQQVAEGLIPNQLLLMEHPSVYTAGRRTTLDERPTDGTPVVDVDRGGKITWHGPGQLVGYPIIRLAKRNDVVGYVRTVEAALMKVCEEFGLAAEQYCDRTGVWIRDNNGDRKIAAIGIRVAKGVTMHGFALNVNPDLTPFTRIIACGIPDVEVTSLAKELGRDVQLSEVIPLIEKHLLPALESVSL
ncbi:MAG: lipoyl(octanoyl) transferase LipB [Actinobacteria bacterium]|uniref:lipoyl(octanoyl) transferase n=1 Tax=freshwater metagenome TaxID=449393 RepID=A0A6J7IYR7_9ZZZZ|nr:lipoyl(octanoyl) transferase LipB [Actinomycetota bacterium]